MATTLGSHQASHEDLPPTKPATPTATAVDEAGPQAPKMTHDSMVTVRLSESSAATLETAASSDADSEQLSPSATDCHSVDTGSDEQDRPRATHRDSALTLSPTAASVTMLSELGECSTEGHESDSSEESDEVNWEQLEKTEDEQVKDDETDNSTALLLARLEQENAKLATNPKSIKVQTVEKSTAGKPRPPSMAQLRQMMHGPAPPALRYSMLPPPPMTDLEFFAALVKDYQQTAARLPTLLSNKIRKGIPPPLRGVVWQSMSGARDASLEEQYDRFCGESSPYELIIGKDLGRSFPGVDMFRDPEGDGQRMLGRVLKSFSLYDAKIGYCQGLAFLVGPLLMHMPDKQAFCVLVRLMERYDLRDCFLPDLSGLHVRIHQFRELLRSNLPVLSSHLEDLQVETAYVSQWFLSFFAVTCPLPMLFRIYDVIFAEGASETLMRVALSLMRKNEARLLACTELEDAMQLLLSRGLWDCYHYNADEFVQDFVGLTGEVTREKLAQLEQGYRESLVATANAARVLDITTAATRFLGRIWASSTIARTATLQPGLGAPSRPLSMLRRSTSKQSLASTLNSMEASSSSVSSSSSSTDATIMSRDSANSSDDCLSRESTPVGSKSIASVKTTDEKYLHSQIEDLLTALSELQRNHALLSNDLQLEREGREEDRKAVISLLDGLKIRGIGHDRASAEDRAQDSAEESIENSVDTSELASSISNEADQATPSSDETEVATSPELNRRIHDMDQEIASLKEQLRERHGHVRSLHQDKQRLEKQVHALRTRASASSACDASSRELDADWANKGVAGGLRELKLGRSQSTPSQAPGFSKRVSSLPRSESATSPASSSGASSPPNDHEALLLELVQAKTAEAMAKQEAEEAKQKLEAVRKAHGVGAGDGGAGTTLTPSNSTIAMGVLGLLTGGEFWGWRR
ncbi:rab-GTPase-TBC domain-containing protein [Hirsutella rhossiliensis]|uniref:Rab-GTPase-TBC domain-containing protein n=1 Tax=Hirsutella rhossiliensis TaxID=111463 RepID=A0A9P8N2C1_9HYPO|nr:rab-GTPase-TBC domain-containing protein [Hirsutella rhossiliensis]KAH0965642.1 rab-GTPase-TBC domain-containing protein [Hirsutella rhossiliensis]